jgi:hypothetical protein
LAKRNGEMMKVRRQSPSLIGRTSADHEVLVIRVAL